MIDIFCVMDKTTSEYASFFRDTAIETSSGRMPIRFCGLSMDKSFVPNGFERVECIPMKSHRPSMDHALAMHQSFQHIKSDIVIFADVDIAIVYPNWDEKISNILAEYSCTGFQYRFFNFPGIIFFCCRRDKVEQGMVDFSPKYRGRKMRARYVISGKDRKRFGVDSDRVIPCDCGWKLPLLFDGKPKTMNQVYGNNPKSQLPFVDEQQKSYCLKGRNRIRMTEFHLDGKLFGTHLKESRKSPFNSKFAIEWRKRIKMYKEISGDTRKPCGDIGNTNGD